MVSEDIVRWLLEPENPSVRYRSLVELLGKSPNDPKATECKKEIAESVPVKNLLNQMHPGGYWLQKNPRTGKIVGDGTEYGAFGTTHFCLSCFAELSMDRTNSQVAKAADRYLKLQKEDGDFYPLFLVSLGPERNNFYYARIQKRFTSQKNHRLVA